ncbi:MAG: hypothetical protein ACT4QA_10130 [Panacagrimonas sp.]
MNPVLIALLVLNLIALLFLSGRYARVRRALMDLRDRGERLASAAPLPSGFEKMAADGAPVIVISILNPMELAAQKHWVAGTLGRISPALVRKIVYQEALKIVSQELPKYGVVAEVRVVGSA